MVQEINFYKEKKFFPIKGNIHRSFLNSCWEVPVYIRHCASLHCLQWIASVKNHKHLEVKNNFLFGVRVKRERKVEPGNCALPASELCQVKLVLEQDKHWQEPLKGNNGEKGRKKIGTIHF